MSARRGGGRLAAAALVLVAALAPWRRRLVPALAWGRPPRAGGPVVAAAARRVAAAAGDPGREARGELCRASVQSLRLLDERGCAEVEELLDGVVRDATQGVLAPRSVERKGRRSKYFFGFAFAYDSKFANGGEVLWPPWQVSAIPEWIQEKLIRPLELAGAVPENWLNCATVNDYAANGCIAPHKDAPQLFGRPIVSVSLFSDSKLTFGVRTLSKAQGPPPVHVHSMRRGEATLLRGYSADNVTHAIRPGDLPARRVSVILRHVFPRAPVFLDAAGGHTAPLDVLLPPPLPGSGPGLDALRSRSLPDGQRQLLRGLETAGSFREALGLAAGVAGEADLFTLAHASTAFLTLSQHTSKGELTEEEAASLALLAAGTSKLLEQEGAARDWHALRLLPAVAQLGQTFPKLREGLLQRLAECAAVAIPSGQAHSVAASLHAIAMLRGGPSQPGVLPPCLLGLVPALGRRVAEAAAALDARGLAGAVWAAASLREEWGDLWRALPALLGGLQARAGQMAGRELVVVAWALGVLLGEAGDAEAEGPLRVRTARALQARARQLVRKLALEDLSCLSWGLSRCIPAGEADVPLMKAVAEIVAAEAPTASPDVVGKELAQILRAFARLQLRHKGMLKAVAARATQVLEDIDTDGLLMLSWSFGEIYAKEEPPRPGAERFRGLLAAALEARGAGEALEEASLPSPARPGFGGEC